MSLANPPDGFLFDAEPLKEPRTSLAIL